ncbi:uncharacterized protein RCC_08719 [Ramularia collo-cygni]|uniref:Uncharacterized protein n=1 Tax=Ramularia collo-cygni TaxID=112498 RepID=A0A2D3VIF3_9PEZI|nr:uncharacterized protein RCC_08719 [Ramularia collo-cygni]CZT23009.1 uncharacterized protein RCC_08719 [Ramularia collo-cygni]
MKRKLAQYVAAAHPDHLSKSDQLGRAVETKLSNLNANTSRKQVLLRHWIEQVKSATWVMQIVKEELNSRTVTPATIDGPARTLGSACEVLSRRLRALSGALVETSVEFSWNEHSMEFEVDHATQETRKFLYIEKKLLGALEEVIVAYNKHEANEEMAKMASLGLEDGPTEET